MNTRVTISWLAIGLGVLSGPGALESAEASQPPIGSTDLLFVLVGTFISGLLVVGFQVLRSNPKFGKLAIAFFGFVALFTLAAGASAFVWAAFHSRLAPSAFLFLAVGCALHAAVAINRSVHKRRFEHAL
jgi:hypothetical protein